MVSAPEGVGNGAGIADRILGPILDACRGINSHHAVVADAELAQLLADAAGFADHLD
jgi:hypothetical protein